MLHKKWHSRSSFWNYKVLKATEELTSIFASETNGTADNSKIDFWWSEGMGRQGRWNTKRYRRASSTKRGQITICPPAIDDRGWVSTGSACSLGVLECYLHPPYKTWTDIANPKDMKCQQLLNRKCRPMSEWMIGYNKSKSIERNLCICWINPSKMWSLKSCEPKFRASYQAIQFKDH